MSDRGLRGYLRHGALWARISGVLKGSDEMGWVWLWIYEINEIDE